MRTILPVVLVAALALLSAAPAAANCQTVGCWRECHAVPGGVRCGTRCRTRCWHPAPRYEAPAEQLPAHADPTPYYTPAASLFPGGLPPELALAAALVVFIVIVIGITSSTSTNAEQDVNADTAANNKIAEEMAEMMRKADQHIATMINKHREGDHHD